MHRAHALLTLFVAACGVPQTRNESCAVTAPRGVVSLEAISEARYEGMRVTLSFQRQPDPRETLRCTRTQQGVCAVTSCTNVGIDFVDGEPTCPGASAGEVVLRRSSGTTLSTNVSQQFTLTPPAFAGETFAIESTGAVVPAFAGSVSLPPRVQVTAPSALAMGTGLTLVANQPLRVQWNAINTEVVVTARGSNGGTYTAECVFPGTAGNGEIPFALLQSATHVEVTTRASTQLMAGEYPITLQAGWAATQRSLLQQ